MRVLLAPPTAICHSPVAPPPESCPAALLERIWKNIWKSLFGIKQIMVYCCDAVKVRMSSLKSSQVWQLRWLSWRGHCTCWRPAFCRSVVACFTVAFANLCIRNEQCVSMETTRCAETASWHVSTAAATSGASGLSHPHQPQSALMIFLNANSSSPAERHRHPLLRQVSIHARQHLSSPVQLK